MGATGFLEPALTAHARMVWLAVSSITWQFNTAYFELRQLEIASHVVDPVKILYQLEMALLAPVKVSSVINPKFCIIVLHVNVMPP